MCCPDNAMCAPLSTTATTTTTPTTTTTTGTTGTIAGEVRVCNTPDHCLTRTFQVAAVDSGGRQVATTTTTGASNDYQLLVPPGPYSLVATSDGLRCTGSATAVAGQSVTADITCLVP
jgi:hypothetical protein